MSTSASFDAASITFYSDARQSEMIDLHHDNLDLLSSFLERRREILRALDQRSIPRSLWQHDRRQSLQLLLLTYPQYLTLSHPKYEVRCLANELIRSMPTVQVLLQQQGQGRILSGAEEFRRSCRQEVIRFALEETWGDAIEDFAKAQSDIVCSVCSPQELEVVFAQFDHGIEPSSMGGFDQQWHAIIIGTIEWCRDEGLDVDIRFNLLCNALGRTKLHFDRRKCRLSALSPVFLPDPHGSNHLTRLPVEILFKVVSCGVLNPVDLAHLSGCSRGTLLAFFFSE